MRFADAEVDFYAAGNQTRALKKALGKRPTAKLILPLGFYKSIGGTWRALRRVLE
jgi:hypothetical protein